MIEESVLGDTESYNLVGYANYPTASDAVSSINFEGLDVYNALDFKIKFYVNFPSNAGSRGIQLRYNYINTNTYHNLIKYIQIDGTNGNVAGGDIKHDLQTYHLLNYIEAGVAGNAYIEGVILNNNSTQHIVKSNSYSSGGKRQSRINFMYGQPSQPISTISVFPSVGTIWGLFEIYAKKSIITDSTV